MKFFTKSNFYVTLGALLMLACNCEKCSTDEAEEEKAPYKGYTITLGSYSADEFRQFIYEHLNVVLEPEHFGVCPCDPGVAFLNHPQLTIEGHGPAQVKTPTGAVGMDIEYAKNFILDTNPSGRDLENAESLAKLLTDTSRNGNFTQRNPLIADSFTGTPNAVAVFDAGLPDALSNLPYENVLGLDDSVKDNLCKPEIDVPLNSRSRLLGVNHISDDELTPIDYKAIRDNTQSQHGVRVTYLLANQRVGQAGSNPLRILTMRVLNSDNKGDLFSLICGMSQAKKLGARIFNMSLGYYGPESPLLRKKMEELAEDKIWVVAAAGNANEYFDEGDPDLPLNRDLTERRVGSKFYPAYFAKDFGNVIAVTTVEDSKEKVCEKQNYGKDIVDIGVVANNCGFGFPGSTGFIAGTSYATPVVTGWIARKVNLSSFTDKASLLSDAEVSLQLENQVKGGKFIRVNSN